MRKGPNAGKTTVMGIVQRGGGIRAFVVPSTRKETLAAHLRSHVARGSIDYLVSKQQMHDEIGRLIYDPTTKKPMERFVQKGVDVDLALRIDRSYRAEGWNHLVLVAGDGDFAELVGDLVEREGVRLTVVGSRQSITSALMPYAGRIVEVSSLAPTITYLRSA